MRSAYLTAGVVAIAMLTAGFASAAEKKISRADLPAEVEKTVQEQSAGATIVGFTKEVEDGQLEYEAAMTVNGHSKSVSIATDGSLLETEEDVDQSTLPASVLQALTARAKGAKIATVESVTKQGKIVSYESTTVKGNKKSEIAVGPNGETLAHED